MFEDDMTGLTGQEKRWIWTFDAVILTSSQLPPPPSTLDIPFKSFVPLRITSEGLSSKCITAHPP
jgi:hypothetical protein